MIVSFLFRVCMTLCFACLFSRLHATQNILTKEIVDDLLDNISSECKLEMEGALDTQWDLTPGCKLEIRSKLMQSSGIDAKTGSVHSDSVDTKHPLGDDSNAKVFPAQKQAKPERDVRKQKESNKKVEMEIDSHKSIFAMKVAVALCVIVLIVIFVCLQFGRPNKDKKNIAQTTPSGKGKNCKIEPDAEDESWMDSSVTGNGIVIDGGSINKASQKKKQKHT